MPQTTLLPSPHATREPFGILPDGSAVDLITLTNSHGLTLRVMTYGGTIISLTTPDRTGQLDDIVLGYDDLAGYVANSPYFGAIVGRYANRIARGRFMLDGVTYQLATNNGPNHLHGGVRGFDKVLWHGESFEAPDRVGMILSYTSPHTEEGYPGTLSARVTYTLTNNNALEIDYTAEADRPTPVNLSQHSYFNLTGTHSGPCRDVLDHEFTIAADAYVPVDATLIPIGEYRLVTGTPFDFRTPFPLGARITHDDLQLQYAGGYDHHFVLAEHATDRTRAVRVVEPARGRTLEVYTTEPGLQVYSGNFLDGTIRGKGGHVYAHRCGFCLETQHAPDSPNQPTFPSTILQPGARYRTRTVLVFGTDPMR
jgi:aldose 1-epimerase